MRVNYLTEFPLALGTRDMICFVDELSIYKIMHPPQVASFGMTAF